MKGINGWLSPDGILIACNYGEHMDKAQEILNKYLYNIEANMMDEYGTFFEDIDKELKGDLNFVHLSSCYGCNGAATFNWDKKLTDEQADWLKSHFNELDKDQQDCVSIKLKRDGYNYGNM